MEKNRFFYDFPVKFNSINKMSLDILLSCRHRYEIFNMI